MERVSEREFKDELVTAPSPDLPERFFDRFVFNLHRTDATAPSALFGFGIYPMRDVVDGFAILVTETEQRNVRFSTELSATNGDGAGPFRLFWSIVLPMSKPIIGVVSVFAIIAAWKDLLWPMLVLPDPAVQPLSVRLPAVQQSIELDVFLAALAISTLIPVGLFLLFQGVFLRSAGLGGAVKG